MKVSLNELINNQSETCGSNVFQDYFDDVKKSRVKQIPKFQDTRFKNQVSRIKIQDQDSRIKRRVNQDKY